MKQNSVADEQISPVHFVAPIAGVHHSPHEYNKTQPDHGVLVE